MAPGQIFLLVTGALSALMLISSDLGNQIFGGVMLAVCIIVFIRSLTAPAVDVTRDAVYLRGLYRTQVVQMSRVAHADVVQSNDGVSVFQKEYLQLTLTSGERLLFTGLKSARSLGGPSSFVGKAARRINSLVEARQS